MKTKNIRKQKKKTIGVTIVLATLLLTPSIAGGIKPYSESSIVKFPFDLVNRKIWYVDDDGGADYTRIQDAIDNASYRDTIYVYCGVYYENISISKSIQLYGENKENTIIDGKNIDDVIKIQAAGVEISGFTIQNSKKDWKFAGIKISSNRNKISDNIIKNNGGGLLLRYSSHNIISSNVIEENINGIRRLEGEPSNNIFSENRFINNSMTGLWLLESNNNKIFDNYFENNHHGGIWIWENSNNNIIISNTIIGYSESGIEISGSSRIKIKNNHIYNSTDGLVLIGSVLNFVYKNEFDGNEKALKMFCSNLNVICSNNFLNNHKNVNMRYLLMNKIFTKMCRNLWLRNYWSGEYQKPHQIKGSATWRTETGTFKIIDIFQYDWIPAKKPFDIPLN